MPFEFEGAAVRVVKIDGEPWFGAKDVAAVLGYSDAEAMTRRLDEDDRQNLRGVGFGPRGVTAINEPGLYVAVLGSQKPEARRFKKWVTGTVLPAIRKDGAYIMGEEKVATGEHSREQLLSASAHRRAAKRHPGAAGPPFPGPRHPPGEAATKTATSANPARRFPGPAHRPRTFEHAPGSHTGPTHLQQSPSRSGRPAAAHHGRKEQKPRPLPWPANADAPARTDEDGDNVSRPTRRRTGP